MSILSYVASLKKMCVNKKYSLIMVYLVFVRMLYAYRLDVLLVYNLDNAG